MLQKQKLYSRLGSELGFLRFQERQGDHSSSLNILDLRPLRELATLDKSNYSELYPGDSEFDVPPCPVVGTKRGGGFTARSRYLYAGLVHDVKIKGESVAVRTKDAAYIDFEEPEFCSLDDDIEFDPAIFFHEGRKVGIIESADFTQIDEAFSLLGPHTHAFGHWIWENIPRFALAKLTAGLSHIPVLIDTEMPDQHRAMLKYVDPDVRLIEVKSGEDILVNRLWISSSAFYAPIYERCNDRFKWSMIAAHPTRYSQLVEYVRNQFLLNVPPPSKSLPKRLYLARKPDQHRKLVNAAEIEAWAVRAGFELIYLQDLDFGDQFNLIRSAEIIVGPDGSAMLMSLFAEPGTQVCMLASEEIGGIETDAALMRACGLEPVIVAGTTIRFAEGLPHFSDYQVDLDALEEALRYGLAGRRHFPGPN